MTATARPLCLHGYVLAQDSCPVCDGNDTPHPADTVLVHPDWATRPILRCRACGQPRGHRIHRTPKGI
jgi:hypothetical protein